MVSIANIRRNLIKSSFYFMGRFQSHGLRFVPIPGLLQTTECMMEVKDTEEKPREPSNHVMKISTPPPHDTRC